MSTLTARQIDKAIAQGDIEAISVDVSMGRVDLNQPQSRYGMLPLHAAAWHGRSAMVNFLVQHGAALEGKSEEGLTALLMACQQGHWDTAECLISLGAQADACDKGGNQALHFASERPGGEKLWAVLAARGVTTDVRNGHGWTAMHVAARSGQAPMLKCLAAADADLNCRDQAGHTPILLAARERRVDTLWALHELGADEGARNRMDEGIGDIVDPLLFEKLGREHEIYWWLRPLMPVQKRYQPEVQLQNEAIPVKVSRSTP